MFLHVIMVNSSLLKVAWISLASRELSVSSSALTIPTMRLEKSSNNEREIQRNPLSMYCGTGGRP
jgi:uncharacterized protein involved in outer membrane biogenesis